MPGTLVAIGLNSPRISFGRFGLDVPHVLVRRAAAEEDVDDRLVLRAAEGIFFLRGGFRAKDVRKRQVHRAERERTDLEEIPAADAVAEPDRSEGKSEHNWTSSLRRWGEQAGRRQANANSGGGFIPRQYSKITSEVVAPQ